MNNTENIGEQMELHTPAFEEHRQKAIQQLSKLTFDGKVLRFDGENRSARSILLEVFRKTDRGNRFVRQTSLNPDVQL